MAPQRKGQKVEKSHSNEANSHDEIDDKKNVDAEFSAMKRISHALGKLNDAEKSRVIQYYADRFVLRS